MSAPLVLGNDPEPLTVRVIHGSAFIATLRCQNILGEAVPWPTGTTLRLVLESKINQINRSWNWVIVAELATISIPAEEIDLFKNAQSVHAQLWLNYGNGEFLWCSGAMTRHA